MLLNWCSASRVALMKQTWSVRAESNCLHLCLLWAVVHPIRRHCTPSDRVRRDVTGARLPGLGLLDASMGSVSEATRAQACCR